MKNFKLWNAVCGWIVFAIAAATYLLTMEPTASFWDCGEFIVSAHKLDVGHPPGAPFFMLMGHFFSLFASDTAHVAMCVNALSALASALTILFLFWTITALGRKLIQPLHNATQCYTMPQGIALLGAGVVGALAYTFSDTFWFSAVEGEVYALSSLFTAVVFWLILKWDEHADEAGSDKWLILIAYLMGLSIGVHLLNLLTIPAIVLVYYFRRYEFSWKGVCTAFGVSFAGNRHCILAFTYPGIAVRPDLRRFLRRFLRSCGTGAVQFAFRYASGYGAGHHDPGTGGIRCRKRTADEVGSYRQALSGCIYQSWRRNAAG